MIGLPMPLRALMQICARGYADRDDLAQLRENAPRFVDMLRNGLNTDMATLHRMAEERRLTIAKIAEAMR